MSILRTTRMLTRYNAWADNLLYDAVTKLPAGEAMKPRQSLFKNIVHTLNHNYIIDMIFQAHMEGREHGFAARNTADYPPLQDLWFMQSAINDWYVKWSDEVNEQLLDEKVSFTFVGGGAGVMTRSEMILHVVNHTTYHRGFIADMFYQIPTHPPTTDLPVFLRDVALQLD